MAQQFAQRMIALADNFGGSLGHWLRRISVLPENKTTIFVTWLVRIKKRQYPSLIGLETFGKRLVRSVFPYPNFFQARKAPTLRSWLANRASPMQQVFAHCWKSAFSLLSDALLKYNRLRWSLYAPHNCSCIYLSVVPVQWNTIVFQFFEYEIDRSA